MAQSLEPEGSASPALSKQGAKQLPFSYAKRNGVLVSAYDNDIAQVSCREGDVTPMAIAEVRRFVGQAIALHLIPREEFDALLRRSYEQGSSDAMQMMGDIGQDMDLSRAMQELPEPEDLLESEDDAPIIRLLNAMFTEAVRENASDIHIEPYENRLAIRFRIDGVLREVLQPDRALAPLVVSRIKVLAKLDIAEKRLPQDGRISIKIAGHPVDVRVSTLPSGHGERVVLRLLDKQGGRMDLEHLGMAPDTMTLFDKMVHRPHGIVLVTGPTGSGKTTTLYAGMTRINDKSRNIMTVEDPIEYYLDGVSQTNVNTKVDMTFARSLRAILRQDPDVVMVGEIRDVETAEIAVQASLTGHLVLSTLHTNSAVGAITRLRDMGVEPFLLASSLLGVLAQRLVRVLCADCKHPRPASPADCKVIGIDEHNPAVIYDAVGCNKCNYLGYRGRIGIYELVEVDTTMGRLIHDGASEQTIEKQARESTPSMIEDGIQRVLNGETTLEELLRVTREA
ncbi:MAG: type II secretion system ATPase GspE [Gammaproteobacteria bacterium]|nr:type II secretion system ATPase GspE [Gammaproteobacteria bacterium]